MSKGIEKPKPYQLQNDLSSIVEIPERVNEIDVVRLKELILYVKEEINNRLRFIDGLLSVNKNTTFEYWANRYTQFSLTYYDLLNLNEFFCIELEKRKKKPQPLSNNLFPFASAQIKECFIEYLQKHILDPYLDFSYLFQRLLSQKFIGNIKHIVFMDWLLKENYISKKTHQEFLIKNQFYSLNKSTSTQRENNFNVIFNKLLS